MIDADTFAKGMLRLATATRQTAEDAAYEFYFEALEHETTPEEWDAFTRHCFSSGRFTWFPKAAELLEALREFRGFPALLPEAVATYERVLESGEYSPEGGTVWTYRRVKETCGRAAAEAFLAAGGHSAFVTTWDEAKRRDAFLEAYEVAAREDPGSRALPPPPGRKAIAGGLA